MPRSEFTESFVASTGASTTISNSAVIANIVVSLAFEGSVGTIISMISSVQLIFLQPGLPLNFPTNILVFFDTFMPFVTFDYIPSDYSTTFIFNFDDDRAETYSDQLGMLKYDTCNFLLNIGSLLFILWIILSKVLVCFIAWILTRTCYKKSNRVYVFYNNL